MTRWVRTASIITSAGLVLGAVVFSGAAQAARRCKPYKPTVPSTDSASADEVKDVKVVKVTDKFTQKKPLVFDYEHGPALWWPTDPTDAEGQAAIVEDTKWFNIQVDSKKRFVGLYVRQEWSATRVSDMDLYIYDKTGSEVASSGVYNQVPEAAGTFGSGDGGEGYEQVLGMGASDCAGYTIESRAFTSPGEAMKLKVWLGSVR